MRAEIGEMLKKIPISFIRPENILTSGKDVQAQDAAQLLRARKFKVPTYQRRYAWKLRDWEGIWRDVPKENHAMGTISVYKEDTRLMVCDGQQRLTTLCLLLSAIMNVASEKNLSQIVGAIEELLFCNVKKYKRWCENFNVDSINEGEAIEFFRLIPTYSDRKTFYVAILDQKNTVNATN